MSRHGAPALALRPLTARTALSAAVPSGARPRSWRAVRLKASVLTAVTALGVVAVCADPSLGSSRPALQATAASTRSSTPAPPRTSASATTPAPARTRTPTHAPTPTRTPTTPPTPEATPGGPQERQPSAAEVAADARAAQLQREVAQQGQKVQAAQQVLADAERTASSALEAYSIAVAAQRDALAASAAQDALLAQAQTVLAQQRVELGRWARQAYVDGGMLSTNPTLVTLLDGGSTDDIARSVRWLTAVGDSRSRSVTAFAEAAAAQDVAARRAAEAQAAASAAADTARQAKAERDAAVQAQRQVVEQLQADLATAVDAATTAQQSAANLAQARRLAAGGGAVTGAVGSCAGGDLSPYSNGQIPLAALCPVWGAAGEYLRADAAYAFDRLSSAYALQYGRPLCVTDAYRTYAEQVAVYASRPGLAAVPGTSNHGWGTAVDLCGGVESFTGAAHLWLLSHAGLYGWFHPAWAEPGGSTPEPWHWEFS